MSAGDGPGLVVEPGFFLFVEKETEAFFHPLVVGIDPGDFLLAIEGGVDRSAVERT